VTIARLVGVLALFAPFAPLACSGAVAPIEGADSGSSTDAGADVRGVASVCLLDAASEKIVTSDLDTYCAARERAGQRPCPKDRRAILSLANDLCAGTSFMLLTGLRDADAVTVYGPSKTNDREQVTWYFSAATGELIGALGTLDPSMGCGKGLVKVGTTHDEIFGKPSDAGARAIPPECGDLCFAGSTTCPEDIVAELPPMPSCEAVPPITHERCTTEETPDIASVDRTCGASSCSRFESGTCWGSCECHRRGRYEWNVECTE
jgi:hypothetical protein